MITPMKAEGERVEIDYDAAKKLAVHLIARGSDALVLSGTTGEAPTVHRAEKAQLIEEVQNALREEFPGREVNLIAGVGSNDTEHTINNSLDAKRLGVNALLVVAPYYSRPSQNGIVEHYTAVANATNMPLIVYDVPGRAGVKIAPETYLRLAKIPNVVGIKDATGNAYQAFKTRTAADKIRRELGLEPLMLYCGDDSLYLPFLSFGATGIISVASHIAGVDFQTVYHEFSRGNIQRAHELFAKMTAAVDIANADGQQAAMMKAAMEQLGVIPSRVMRLPNLAISDEQASELVPKLSEMSAK
jgi:4-hydroxy-tetrahydrodipicolinate synthase